MVEKGALLQCEKCIDRMVAIAMRVRFMRQQRMRQ
jgi:hypothetical protein